MCAPIGRNVNLKLLGWCKDQGVFEWNNKWNSHSAVKEGN
jgi:hypothetical protein